MGTWPFFLSCSSRLSSRRAYVSSQMTPSIGAPFAISKGVRGLPGSAAVPKARSEIVFLVGQCNFIPSRSLGWPVGETRCSIGWPNLSLSWIANCLNFSPNRLGPAEAKPSQYEIFRWMEVFNIPNRLGSVVRNVFTFSLTLLGHAL